MTTLPMISKVYLIDGFIKSKSSQRDSLKPRHSIFFCYLDPGMKFRIAEQCFLMMAVYNLLGSNLETCAGIFGCPQNTCIYWAGMLVMQYTGQSPTTKICPMSCTPESLSGHEHK